MKAFKTFVWGALFALLLSGTGSCTVNAYPRAPRHRVWVPGHWVPGHHSHRHWVQGHYEYR
ncbi:hypothetical protein [Niabella aurantiaca]|uniref:hypothetical protein n=1 Tax=Niabella aurantiaca TaxID=379900 RepID=UPI00037754BC|nr:hypothetical protein [Niabella aurantiaca]